MMYGSAILYLITKVMKFFHLCTGTQLCKKHYMKKIEVTKERRR